MIEYKEENGKLVPICNHEFTDWMDSHIINTRGSIRRCKKCGMTHHLVPKDHFEVPYMEPKMPIWAKAACILMIVGTYYILKV